MTTDDYAIWDEGVAASIDGKSEDGASPLILGEDVLIHWRLGAIEQGALNRVALSDDSLKDELDRVVGKVALGEPEALRLFLHNAVDSMFSAIYLNRGKITSEQAHLIRHGHTTLNKELEKNEK